MNNFFNMDNGFFTFLNKVCDIVMLSIIWVVMCIPIITIGPANTALYYATVKVIRRERGYIFREFFKSFRLNFKRAAIIGVILTVIFAILAIDLMAAWGAITGKTTINSVFIGVYIALTVFILSFAIYVFPVLSRFDMGIKQLVKAASFMAIRHLLHTILMIAVLACAVFAIMVMPIAIIFVPALASLIISFLMERVLKKYTPQSDENDKDSARDEWYLE